MSILSQFFQGRHKNQSSELTHKNETIAAIFTQQYNPPKPAPSSTLKSKRVQSKQRQQQILEEDNNDESDNEQPINSKQAKKRQFENKKDRKQSKQNLKAEAQQKTKRIKKKEKKQKQQQAAEEVQQADDDDKDKQKAQEPENLESTVFVGNIPLSSTHQSVRKYFEKFGKVQKVWFRSIPVQQSKIPKKGLHILKKYQEGADSMNAYVKYEKIEQATAACAANGDKIGDNNIKVTLCKEYDLDYETTIFIGNLPRKIKDQQLWDAFKSIGVVKAVRVIRSKQNFQSIGIGYVRFETKEQMKNAISQMNGKQIGGRPMRIKKAVSKERLDKKARKVKQNKEKKLNKFQTNDEKTGKGIRTKENPEKQFQTKGFKNNNYDKTKPISKKPRDGKPQKYEKKPFAQKKVEEIPKQSNQIIRSKFGFHGKKIMLQ